MLATMNYNTRNDRRRHSDVLYMHNSRSQAERRDKVRRQSYAINQQARTGLDQLRSVRRDVSSRRPEAFDNNFNKWQPDRNTEGARRLHRADPTLQAPKKVQVILDSNSSEKQRKINKRCPACKTRNVFDYSPKNGSSMAVQCFKCSLKFFLELKTKRIDNCPKCSSRNQFTIAAGSSKIRVQCYQCKFSFVSNKDPSPSPHSDEKSDPSPNSLPSPANPLNWELAHVQQWLRSIGMAKYAPRFEDDMIDGQILLEDVDQKLLEDAFDIPKLHAKKIMTKIVGLRAEVEYENDSSLQVPKQKSADIASLQKSKNDHLARIRLLQEQKNELELNQVNLVGPAVEASRKRKKQISREIKKRLKKIKKIDTVLKNKPSGPSQSASSDTEPIENPGNKKLENIKKANDEKRRQSAVLDQELAEKTKRLQAMEERLRAQQKAALEAAKTSAGTEPPKPPPHAATKTTKKVAKKKMDDNDDSYNFDDSLSDLENENLDDLSDLTDEDEGPMTDFVPSLNRNMSVSDRLFANLIGGVGSVSKKGDNKNTDPSVPANWSAEKVGEWLEEVGFPQYSDDFSTMEVTGHVLLSHQVNERYLKNIIHVKENDLKPLMAKINDLKLDHAPSIIG